jgi:tartrate dehydratase alpha subunit/fumarate hydratase class I-like protein
VRYVHYFEGVYKRLIQSPTIKILEKIVITTVPRMNNEACTPYIEVLSGRDFEMIWTNKHSTNLKTFKNTDEEEYQHYKSYKEAQ